MTYNVFSGTLNLTFN